MTDEQQRQRAKERGRAEQYACGAALRPRPMRPMRLRDEPGALRPVLLCLTLALSLPACALIDAMADSEHYADAAGGHGDDSGGNGDGGPADANTEPVCFDAMGLCFKSPTHFDSQVGSPHTLVMAHFNPEADSHLDVAVAGTTGFAVLAGVGDGGFSEPYWLASGVNVPAMVAGQFTSDTNMDLAAYDMTSQLRVFQSAGAGDFLQHSAPGFNTPAGMVAIDFEGDGKDDILALVDGQAVPIDHVDTGDYQARTEISVDPGASHLIGGDFLGAEAGQADFAFRVGETFHFYEGAGDATFASGTPVEPSLGSVFAVGRWRKRGQARDWITALGSCSACDDAKLLTMHSVGGGEEGDFRLTSDKPFQIVAATATGYFLDSTRQQQGLVVVADTGNVMNVLVLDDWNDQTFRAHVLLSSGDDGTRAVAAGDLDGDGIDDIVTASSTSSQLRIFLSRKD